MALPTITATAADWLQQLHDLEQQLNDREAALASAAEAMSQREAVQAAYACGVQQERLRVLALIRQQLDHLYRGGLDAISLRALAQAVQGAPEGPHHCSQGATRQRNHPPAKQA